MLVHEQFSPLNFSSSFVGIGWTNLLFFLFQDCLTEQILSQQQELCLNKKMQQKQIVVLLLSLCIDINVLFG